jgi:RimJ/RimL family protein N-acetyltransferase
VTPDWPIETERLVLRPYEEGDFDALHELYSDEDVVRWLYYGPATVDETRARLARKIAAGELTSSSGPQAAVLLHDGTYVGDISLWLTNVEHRTAEIGFSILPRHQGHGYAPEAARAFVDWAFVHGDVHRIEGRLEARNTASARVLEKVGMRLEAHLVENEWIKGEWQSGLGYAILEREWPR